ncbi:FAD-binding oxidoreductase [Roseinatronobacter sp.]|uniref:NAD(P)/FAD-dependent oxidoreductase n=1 Tax=Roseinatronobacter sp. TaxID=1945755 RepID=UPI0025D97D24|nr:FAD-binding oxidoreductase [Rhodobaca sp.]
MISEPNLWHATSREEVHAQPLSDNLSVDLAVIGGGFTGCSAALEAARAGASVCLLEAEQVGHGGSGRNVGLVNAGLWLPPQAVIDQMGQPAGLHLIQTLAQAPEQVFALIARESIDCEATRNGTLHLAHSAAGLRDLQERFRQGVGLGAPLSLLDAQETARRVGTDQFHGALFDPRAGTIQPLAYVQGLARAAQSAGAALHIQSPVTSLDHADGDWVLRSNGHTVRARKILVATNAYHLGIIAPFQPRFVPVYYSQYATDPLPESLRKTILAGAEGCWDTALVMSSMRMDQAGRLILGGIGNGEGVAGRLHGAWAQRKLAALFPALKGYTLRHGWAGRIAMTSDHLPRIVAFGPNALACFGYSGRGIGPGTVFGLRAAQALLRDDTEGLPVAPVSSHVEHFTTPRALWVEAGASLIHASAARFGAGKPRP